MKIARTLGPRQARLCLVGGLVCFVILALMAILLPGRGIWDSYLNAFLFWAQIPLGSMGFLMLHNLVGGDWGRLIRPVLVASLKLTWLLPLLFVPVFFGLGEVFPWAAKNASQLDPLIRHKAIYLNVPFFI